MKHTLPKMGYAYDALEPYIDRKTMEVHYTKHHQGYVDKLNAALEGYPALQKEDVKELVRDIGHVPEKIRAAVRNHGGGHLNHSFFWPLLKKDVEIGGRILDEIEKAFGSFDRFIEEFSAKAMTVFGSGWAWLVYSDGKLEIVATPNQDNPVSMGKTPVLGIDVWEHAYYLKYQNRRAEYVDAFFNVIDWKQVEKNLEKAEK